MRVGLVFNPTAGGGGHARAGSPAEDCLRHRGMEVVVRATRGPGDGTRVADRLADEVDAIVAIGGDGTVNEVVNALPGRNIPLGIVPMGTVNVLALELGLPFDLEEACEVIARGFTVPFDLGVVDGRSFVIHTGAGLDALTIRRLDSRAKRRYREAAFVWTGLRAFLDQEQPEFPVIIDGEEHRANFVVVGNCRYYGGRFGITNRADPADGELDVVLFRGDGFLETALFWLAVPIGLHLRHPATRYLRGRRVVLGPPEGGRDVWFQTDGELAGRLPATVESRPQAVRIFVPGTGTRNRGESL
jgi:diacylglycerol kinase (ATP)